MLTHEYCYRDLFWVCSTDFVRQSLLQKPDNYLCSSAFPFIKATHVYTHIHVHDILHIYCSSGKEEIKTYIGTSLRMCSKALVSSSASAVDQISWNCSLKKNSFFTLSLCVLNWFVRFELVGDHQEVCFSWCCSWEMDSLLLMGRAKSLSSSSSLPSLHFCLIVLLSKVPIWKLPSWKSRMNYKTRVEPRFSKSWLLTSVSVI